MENNKELQKTITRGILKAQLIGVAISIGITVVIGFILVTFAKKSPPENKDTTNTN